jgi:dipeptidase D
MPAVTDPFAGLEPHAFWRHFEALTGIPRASHDEEATVEHVEAWALPRGFATRRDAAGNLVVDVPATAGRAHASTVILQGHLDMVCEREPDSPHDPRTGPVRVLRDDEWLRADGTTLGADDGVAIAAMMAVAEDPGVPHGPLELLMTVAEEVGLDGAAKLDPTLITGSVLLNLDSEEDATLTVGCAGGAYTVVRFDPSHAPVADAGIALRVSVGGGLGGHSGDDIALGRANAIKVLGRVLRGVPGLRVAAFDGGASSNAIPRDAAAVVVIDAAGRVQLEAQGERARQAYSTTDPGLRVVLSDAVEPVARAWTESESRRLLDLVAALPAGPLGMSADFPGIVETSSSVGVAKTEDERLTLTSLSRSANDGLLPDVVASISGAAALAGAGFELSSEYPGWRPDLTSPTLAAAKAVHERLFGAVPHVTLTHGGLEVAIIAAKRPGVDPISFGPEIEGAHAPGERLHIESALRFMRLLRALLDELSCQSTALSAAGSEPTHAQRRQGTMR